MWYGSVPYGPRLSFLRLYNPEELSREVCPKLIYYNRLPEGGHFLVWEQPELFVTELRAAFKSLR
jgi:pimeloyl-ACP methyl ester carboxylesterase